MDVLDQYAEDSQLGTQRLIGEDFSLYMARKQSEQRVRLDGGQVTEQQVKEEMEITRSMCTPINVKGK